MNSGIYAITNIVNGKVYIGSTNNFEGRWGEHERTLCKGSHHNCYLQRSWNKYGKDAFEFGVLEYLGNLDELAKAEQFWMDKYREDGKELYNIGECADCPWRGQERSEEHRQRLIESYKSRPIYRHSEKDRKKISKSLTGKKLSGETRRKISVVLMGNQHALGAVRTEETRSKLSKALKGNKNCLGRKLSDETKRKISEAVGNRPPISEETRCKISKTSKNRKHSEETRRKISEANKGRKHTEETRLKMSKARKEWWARIRENNGGSK